MTECDGSTPSVDPFVIVLKSQQTQHDQALVQAGLFLLGRPEHRTAFPARKSVARNQHDVDAAADHTLGQQQRSFVDHGEQGRALDFRWR